MKIDLTRQPDNMLRIDTEGRVLLLCPRCRVEHVGPMATPQDIERVAVHLLRVQQQDIAALADEVQRLQHENAALREEWGPELRMSR